MTDNWKLAKKRLFFKITQFIKRLGKNMCSKVYNYGKCLSFFLKINKYGIIGLSPLFTIFYFLKCLKIIFLKASLRDRKKIVQKSKFGFGSNICRTVHRTVWFGLVRLWPNRTRVRSFTKYLEGSLYWATLPTYSQESFPLLFQAVSVIPC